MEETNVGQNPVHWLPVVHLLSGGKVSTTNLPPNSNPNPVHPSHSDLQDPDDVAPPSMIEDQAAHTDVVTRDSDAQDQSGEKGHELAVDEVEQVTHDVVDTSNTRLARELRRLGMGNDKSRVMLHELPNKRPSRLRKT